MFGRIAASLLLVAVWFQLCHCEDSPLLSLAKNTNYCSDVVNPLIDLAIRKLLANETLTMIPDVKGGTLEMSRIKLTGLNTLYRACSIMLERDPVTEVFTGSMCIGTEQLSLSALIQIPTYFGMKIKELFSIHIHQVQMSASVALRLKPGSVGQLTAFRITELGKVKINSAGLIGSFQRVINWLLSTRVKNFIVGIIEGRVKNVVQTRLDEFKL